MKRNINFLIITLCMMIFLSACTDKETVKIDVNSNERYNRVAQYQGNVYYIKENNLWQDIQNPQLFAENVYSVQEYNDTLYYATKSDEETWLMQYDGESSSKLSGLPGGHLDRMVIRDDTIYVLAEHELFVKKFTEEEFSLTKSSIIDFMLHGDKLYYETSEVTGLDANHESFETFETYISDSSQVKISCSLVEVDLHSNKEIIIAENDAGFLMTPTSSGIVYYDREETALYQYTSKRSEALEKALVTSVITYDDNVVYTAFNKNAVHKLSLSDRSNQKVADGIKQIVGVTDGYLYTHEGEWLSIE